MVREITTYTAGAALAVVGALLTACSDSPPGPGPTPSAPTTTAPSPPGWTPLTEDTTGLLPAGRVGLAANGRPDAPWAVVEVPEGFSTIGGWVIFDEDPEGGGGVGYWTISEVVRDPCSELGDDNAIDAGRTAVDLVRSLRRQKLTRMTAPVPVTVDGYEGHSLEMHVPKGIDFAECPAYNLWESDPAGARHMSGPGEVDKLWILDVEGEVVVLTATVPGDAAARKSAVERMTPIVESAQFVARE
jgi:hypothetical protein